MFEFIIGDVVNINDEYVIVQNNGIGYKIFTSKNSMMNLEIGKKNQILYTQLHVREDGVYIYGFTTEEEMNMFNLLLRVTKIGPKVGIATLSTLNPNEIKIAIHNNDIDLLCKAPGIGKKTAQRIVLELKDKIDDVELLDSGDQILIDIKDYDEAVEALISLGYLKFEVEKAIKNLDIKDLTVEEIIREGLKQLSKN
ncbi:MAG TPA: Holliday junction branch migration protein RuvA [Tissierellaceae bacterium]|nr:Holliday junction branch migration protein RuvA [Tissierellaceae bacterium]